MSWRVALDNGVYLPDIGWRLDARRPAACAFVSHAHFDHLGRHETVLSTPATARLARGRLGNGRRRWIEQPFFEPVEIAPGVAATLYPAGHIFGSAMLKLESDRLGSLLYTGDFKLAPGAAAETCVVPQADTVVMESTFGRPRYAFPPLEEVADSIARFCREALETGHNPVLLAYSLGKSQEALLALRPSGLPVMMRPPAFETTRLCASLGLDCPEFEPFDPLRLAGRVVISPPPTRQSRWLQEIPRPKTALLSGWALDPSAVYRYRCDAAIPLSDHADYRDLLGFVERARPKRILTVHGAAAAFASDLRASGRDAWALGQENQLDLPLFAEAPDSAGNSPRRQASKAAHEPPAPPRPEAAN